MNDTLLATDLDDTLIGDTAATNRLNEIIVNLKANGSLKLAYVTGRSPELFNELKHQKRLLTPDALVTAIGTEIYIDGEKLPDWPRVAGWDYQELKAILARHRELELQPATEQREHKLSYFLDNNETLAATVRNELASYPVDVVYSMGRYFDILPKAVNKGTALRFLADKWHIQPTNIYACGDSVNDATMLLNANAIVVGNAKQELIDAVASKPRATVYIAKSTYANGIIEGLTYYGVY